MTFFEIFVMQDYVLFFVSFFFAVLFVFLWLEQLYKSYLWIIIGLCIFSMINLSLSWMTNEWEYSWLKLFFYNHREFFSLSSLFFILLFAIALPLNDSITFRIWRKKIIKVLASFIFWFFYVIFFISVFLSIIQNRFFFSIDEILIWKTQASFLFEMFHNFFSPSILYQKLLNYDYVISFVMTLYIFYKMTIGALVDMILLFIINFIKNILDNSSKNIPDNHDDDIEEEHHSHA